MEGAKDDQAESEIRNETGDLMQYGAMVACRFYDYCSDPDGPVESDDETARAIKAGEAFPEVLRNVKDIFHWAVSRPDKVEASFYSDAQRELMEKSFLTHFPFLDMVEANFLARVSTAAYWRYHASR